MKRVFFFFPFPFFSSMGNNRQREGEREGHGPTGTEFTVRRVDVIQSEEAIRLRWATCVMLLLPPPPRTCPAGQRGRGGYRLQLQLQLRSCPTPFHSAVSLLYNRAQVEQRVAWYLWLCWRTNERTNERTKEGAMSLWTLLLLARWLIYSTASALLAATRRALDIRLVAPKKNKEKKKKRGRKSLKRNDSVDSTGVSQHLMTILYSALH